MFDETVRLASSADDLMRASPGELNVLQAAATYGLNKHVETLLSYPGKYTDLSMQNLTPYYKDYTYVFNTHT